MRNIKTKKNIKKHENIAIIKTTNKKIRKNAKILQKYHNPNIRKN